MSESTRVVVADDTLLIRQGVLAILALIPDVEVVAECDDQPSLLAAVESHTPDVVLTDVCMPPTMTDEGIQAALTIRQDHPDIGVVVLSQFAEPEYVLRLFENGSDSLGYLLKDRLGDPDELGRAITSVAGGGSVVDAQIVDVLVQARTTPTSTIDRLTPREQEVLALMAEGFNNAGIAERLVLSEKAVAKHINSMFSKLDLNEIDHSHKRVKAVLSWARRMTEPAVIDTAQAAQDAEALVTRMQAFMRSNQVIAAGVIVLGIIIGSLVVQTWLAVAFVAVLVVNIAAMEVCHRRIDETNVVRVGMWATFANWALCIALAPMVSFALPVLMFPILITLLAMAPLLDRSQVVKFILSAAGVITVTATLALAIEGPIDEEIPDNLGHVLVVICLAALTVPTGFLAWDTFVRNAVAVERLAGSNALLRASRRRLVEVADEERKQLERNLHDGAQQQLVGLAMRLRLLGVQHPEATADVEGLLDDLSSAIDELRELAHGLYPPLLEARGLPEALQVASQRSPLQVAVEADVGRYDQQIETALYFCALEALQNATKYAGADARVSMALADDGRDVTLIVSDDGPGFEMTASSGGRGLDNMTDRLAAVDGELLVTSAPGQGTTISARVPHGCAGTPMEGGRTPE